MTPIPTLHPSGESAPLLQVDDLHVTVRTPAGVAEAVRGASFEVDKGEVLTILGESGSGKTVTATAIMGTLPSPPFAVSGGRILLDGENILELSRRERAKLRGERIAVVFQDALSALNPAFTVGWQIGETLRRRRGLSRRESMATAAELMDQMQIPNAKARAKDYPHEFSGGMRQRVVIAMALALEPDLLIADEPTTALDVTVQSEILRLLSDIQQDRDMAMILITHDMGVAAQVSDRVAIMYAGRVLESGSVEQIFRTAQNPYTNDLLASTPRSDATVEELPAIEGNPPDLLHMPSGCPYHPRCGLSEAECSRVDPPLYRVDDGHVNACIVRQRQAEHERR